jgi:beta-phosphoglucomutase-like phosphatase (HAD superfamily)
MIESKYKRLVIFDLDGTLINVEPVRQKLRVENG